MRNFWKIALSIAFGVILLQVMILLQEGEYFKFSWFKVASLSSLALAVYYYIFEHRSTKNN